MKRFRRARGRTRGQRWLSRLAGPCLAAVLAAWPAVLTAGGVASSGVAAPARAPAPVLSATLTAVLQPQARVVNPGPPTGLSATAGNGQVSLSWTPPASNGGAAIIGYDVYMGTTPHGESASPVNTTLIPGTSYTVTGLANGTTYYFTADAVNAASLRSVASAEASATPVAPVTAPGAPTGLTATAGNAQVSLSWKAPASDGGAQITGYDIYEGTTSTITGKPVASATGTGATVKNLANGTTYYFKVTAVNQVGQGPGSGVASATPAAPVTNPGAPTGLTATAGNAQVSLSWTAPASDGGVGIAGYEVYQGTSPGGESKAPVNGALVTATGYTVTGLTNGTTYYFTVAAVNQAKRQGNTSGEASAAPAAASAPASTPASVTAPASQPAGTPGGAGTPGAPSGLTATPGNGQVSLSWTAPAGAASAPARYDVYEGTSPGFPLGTPVRSTTGTSTIVTGLKNGTRYYFVVTALDVKGTVSGSSGEASAEPTAAAALTSNTAPVIVALAAVAVVAVAAALALAVRRLRGGPSRHARKRPPPAPPSDVRAVPEPGRPGPVSIHEMHEIGVDETYTVRLEPLPAEVITIFEEIGS